MSRRVDLHLHTNHSDGSDPPRRVVERAVEAGLAAVAITDHDAVSAIPKAEEAARSLGIAFLPGTEISAHHEGVEVHVLGLGIDPSHPPLVAALAQLKAGREQRASAIVERLHELHVPVDWANLAGNGETPGTVGRLHIAREIHALGFAQTVQDAFEKYIGRGRPAFVAKPKLPCPKAIALIRDAGGLAFLAHPGIGAVRRVLRAVLTNGFDGIEAYHTKHTPHQVQKFLRTAHEHELLITGGSDCHGRVKNQPPEMGRARVPYECYERIAERLGRA